MSRIAVISDLHFGTVPQGMAEALLHDLHAHKLDVVIVAGDLTQRARRIEFVQASEFLAAVPGQVIVLPGNHDLPAWNLFERALRPLRRYRRYFDSARVQHILLNDAMIVGVNTSRRAQPHLRWQEGAIRRIDAIMAHDLFRAEAKHRRRLLFTHHPLLRVEDVARARPARRARFAVKLFQECKVDLLISGHTHLPFRFSVDAAAKADGHDMVALGAPSALSSRLRGEPNGYWLLTVGNRGIDTELRSYRDGGYHAMPPELLVEEASA
jgi:3',5'-cyclic AMP phosphodiesterase CpdA